MTDQNLGFVHRYIPGDQKGPVLLLLHGTGGDENDLLDLGRALAPDASLLSPRGKVMEGGAPRFFRRLAEGVFDLKDLRARTHELANFVTDAAKVYGFDPGRLVAVGYSNGANIAASVLLLRPGTFHRAVLFRAMVPLVPETRPDLQGTSVFLSEGRFDPIIPAQQGERLADMLRKSGADVTIHIVPASHGLIVDDVRQAAAWLGDLLGAPVAG